MQMSAAKVPEAATVTRSTSTVSTSSTVYCMQSTTRSSTTLLERIITVCARENPTVPR